MPKRRNTKAAKKFFRKIMRKVRFAPKVLGERQTEKRSSADEGIGFEANSLTAQGVESSSRTLPSMDKAEGEEDAAVHISRWGTKIPIGRRDDLPTITAKKTSIIG